MKKIITLILTLALVIGLFPAVGASAASWEDMHKKYIENSKKYPIAEVNISVGESYKLVIQDYTGYGTSISNCDPEDFAAASKKDDKIASVKAGSDDGLWYIAIKGKAAGTAYIIADEGTASRWDHEHGVYLYDCVKVNVTEGAVFANSTKESGIPYIQLTDGGKAVSAKLSGVKGTVTYKSSDKKVFKVSSKGKITPVKPGVATLTATVGKTKYTATVCIISKGLQYKDGAVTSLGKCKDKAIVIGRYDENGKKVSSIQENAFLMTDITSVDMSASGLTDISDAFDGCSKLKTVKFPGTLVDLCANFSGTAVETLTIPASVKNIALRYGSNYDTIERKMYYQGKVTDFATAGKLESTASVRFPGLCVKKVIFESAESLRNMYIEGSDGKYGHDLTIEVEGKTYKSRIGITPMLLYYWGLKDAPRGQEKQYDLYKRIVEYYGLADCKDDLDFAMNLKVVQWKWLSYTQKARSNNAYNGLLQGQGACGTISLIIEALAQMSGRAMLYDQNLDKLDHAWNYYLLEDGNWVICDYTNGSPELWCALKLPGFEYQSTSYYNDSDPSIMDYFGKSYKEIIGVSLDEKSEKRPKDVEKILKAHNKAFK